MKRHRLLTILAAFGLLSVMVSLPSRPVAQAQENTSQAQENTLEDFVPPIIFQAAGPTIGSIQSSVDAYRTALGETNNGNAAGPLRIDSGHREINWDGLGAPNNQTTTVSGNPFAGFQVTRGALFTTPDGVGFVQAPAAADPALFPPGGLAGQFDNPAYGTIFKAFSLSRLFSAIGSNITDVTFFEPGANNGDKRAAVTGFGAVFTDVDLPDGSSPGTKRGTASTLIEYFDADGKLLFSSFVPASPGDGSFSFFGIVFEDARIARVRITSGNRAPGLDDGGKRDVVMMDDFIYGEPQRLP